MNFLEAVKVSNNRNVYLRRKGWADGVAMFIARPKDRDDKKYKYSNESRGAGCLATCHVAACELDGVRSLADILAEDWELMYPDE